MAKKQPYIPVYMGDDMRECGHLTLEVYGAYCRLRFALWDSKDRGRLPFDIEKFKRVMAADTLNHAQAIIQTLVNEDVLKIENGTVCKYLVRPEMVEAHRLSQLRKQTGSKGGKNSQQNRNQKNNSASPFALANNQPNSEAKREQNPEIENEDVIDNENSGVGGLGEEPNAASSSDSSGSNGEHQQHSFGFVPAPFFSEYTEYSVDQCLEYYRTSGWEMARNTLAQTWKITPDKVLQWAEIFVTELKSRGKPEKTMADFAQHFSNWLNLKKDKQNPDKYFEYAGKNGQPIANGANTGAKGAGLAELLELRNNAQPRADTEESAEQPTAARPVG